MMQGGMRIAHDIFPKETFSMKISEASRPFLFQKRPDSQLTRGRRAAFWLWNILILLCAAAGVTGAMLLLAPGP